MLSKPNASLRRRQNNVKSNFKRFRRLDGSDDTEDCTELKKLIIENPQAPLLIFAGEEAYSGQYGYESADMAVCKRPIKTMAQLNKILSAA